jgi:hypothetical protein
MKTNTCPQCKEPFTPKSKSHRFCEKPCYYKYNNERYKENARQETIRRQENPTFPKFIDDEGVEHQLDFDPIDHKRFERFKRELKENK